MISDVSGLGADAGYLSGRWSDVAHDAQEVRALRTGMDFRLPQHRREVFLRFYEFHLRYRAHPGAVYYLMPYLFDGERGMDARLWFAFINGCTQNPVTSTIIYRRFPRVPKSEKALAELGVWFNDEWARLPFDTDRRYQKRQFPEAVCAYQRWLDGGSQHFAFVRAMGQGSDQERFDALWRVVREQFVGFGRLGTWSYLEYLRIMGLELEPSSMLLRDMDGSKSHRNGLAIVLGRDDLDWQKGRAFQGRYSAQVLDWLEREADELLSEARERAASPRLPGPTVPWARPWAGDVSRFTLESALCTFKGWFRENRRYPNVYNDMLRDRIAQAEALWPQEDFGVFHRAREVCLPAHLRVECCPGDPGLARPKQNHFRLTGQVVMMDQDWGVFRNDGSWMEK